MRLCKLYLNILFLLSYYMKFICITLFYRFQRVSVMRSPVSRTLAEKCWLSYCFCSFFHKSFNILIITHNQHITNTHLLTLINQKTNIPLTFVLIPQNANTQIILKVFIFCTNLIRRGSGSSSSFIFKVGSIEI